MPDDMITLVGSAPQNRHPPIGAADPHEIIHATVRLKRRTEEGLPTLAQFIEGKRSAGITRQQLVETYGASPAAAAQVEAWAKTQGLSVAETDLGARRVVLTGPVEAMEKAFGVKLSLYRHARTGRSFRSPDRDTQIPAALAPVVSGVFGLSDMPVVVRHSQRVARKATDRDPKVAWPGSYYPQEVAKLYNFPPTTGKGQRVAILEFGGGIDRAVLSDYFLNYVRLPKTPTINAVSILNTPIQVDQDVTGEVYLDIEVVGAMAPDAVQDVYFAPWTGDGYLTAIETALRSQDCVAISISYGLDEDARGDAQNPGWPALHAHVDEAFRDAAAVGVPLFVSSGDQGSSSLRGRVGQDEVTVFGQTAAVAFPASSPYATAVGGTMLYSGAGETREIVWNELGPLIQQKYYLGGATGGGVSDRYPTPSYQTAAGVRPRSANNPGGPGRGVPDVAGNSGSSTGYLVSQPPGSPVGKIAPVGGTSAAAPMWAALVACWREDLASSFGGPIPHFFFNDFVYANGGSGGFRDIVGGREFDLDDQGRLVPGPFKAVGDNVSAQPQAYQASAGYDLCTGWGSPDGRKLLTELKTWLATQARPAALQKA